MAIIEVSISESITPAGAGIASKQTSSTVTDVATAADSLLAGLTLTVSIEDATYAFDSVGAGRSVGVSVNETLQASDSATVNRILNVLIEENARISVGFAIDGVSYDGWVMNPNTFAASRYKGFNFNSYTQYQGAYYGCAKNGVHELSGETDDGTPIDAFLSTGNVKPFANSMSRIHNAYLILKNDGEMLVTVVIGDQSYTYPVEKNNDFHAPNRVKIGKKAKSVIWRFEVKNQDGADFDVESFKIYPIELTRHI
jgi:hypothetical protein